MYFSAGDGAGIGVARSTTGKPEGPYEDVLGRPLVGDVLFGGQPIDPAVFVDDDGRAYLVWGGWSHGLGAELNEDMVSLKMEPVELTPPNYVEAPYLIKRKGVYYYMYSVGGYFYPLSVHSNTRLTDDDDVADGAITPTASNT